MKAVDIIKNGLVKENPTWVLVLGMCPTLATTSSAINGMCMGLATAFVLTMSNIVISLLKTMIPDKVRIPAFIVVIATFVTIVQLVMQAYLPDLYSTLGLFIPLIVVNCIVLGRAEAFASKNNVWHSLLDGLFMGLGFTWALTLVGLVRAVGCRRFLWPQLHRRKRRHAPLHPRSWRIPGIGISHGLGEKPTEKVIKKVKTHSEGVTISALLTVYSEKGKKCNVKKTYLPPMKIIIKRITS